MQILIVTIHVITSLLLILVVLIQSGKGAEISASFGGSSQTVFGSSGGANFFTRFTAALAGIFMVTSISLTLIGAHDKKSVMEGAAPAQTAPVQTAPATAPAAPANPADQKK
jgi:preprotein translocase subunit SecG